MIACYFHRTERCPTCQKISAYIEESVNAGFASELKDKTVRMTMVDFQDAKNKKYAEAYGIDGPTLVVMNVRNGKVVDWKAAPEVWGLVGEKEKFVDYVQSEVRSYLEEETTDIDFTRFQSRLLKTTYLCPMEAAATSNIRGNKTNPAILRGEKSTA